MLHIRTVKLYLIEEVQETNLLSLRRIGKKSFNASNHQEEIAYGNAHVLK